MMHGSRAKSRTRLLNLLILGFMLVSLLAPITDLAFAQENEGAEAEQQLQGQQEPPEGEEPTDQAPDALPTDEPPLPDPTIPAEPDQDQTTEPTAETPMMPAMVSPGQVDVHYHECPPSTDLETGTLETECTGTANVIFDLTNTDMSTGIAYQAATVNGRADFLSVEPGSYRLTLPGKPGWEMAAWCDVLVSEDRGNTRPYTSRKLVEATLGIDIQPGEVLSCQWFAQNPRQLGELAVTVSKCEEGLETVRYDYADLRTRCVESLSPISIDVTNLNTLARESFTINPATHPEWPNGYLMWEVPVGVYDIEPRLDTAVDRLGAVYCLVQPLAPDGSEPRHQSVTIDAYEGYRFTYAVEMDARTDCHLFIEPVVEIDLEISKYDCTHGTEAASLDHDALLLACQPAMDPVEFAVDAVGLSETITADPRAGSIGTLEGIPPGDLQIHEIVPKDWALESVYCAIVPEKDRNNPSYSPDWKRYDTNDRDTISLATTYRDLVRCEFFNEATENDRAYPAAQITIVAYGCAITMDWTNTSHDDLRAACTAPSGEVVYTVVAGDSHDQEAVDEQGQARFPEVPVDQGPITITQYIQSPTIPGTVYCSTGDAYQQMIPADAALSFELREDDRLACHYFNHVEVVDPPIDPPVEDGYGTITVTKWTCPEGISRDLSPDTYAQQCTAPGNDVTFTMSDAGSPRMGTTVSGTVRWNDVVANALGGVSLRETIPAGYGTPVAFCAGNENPLSPVSVSRDGSTSLDVPAGGEWIIDCTWLNIPESPASVTLYKWDCVEGVVIERTTAAHRQHCDTPLDGVTFTLSDGSEPRALVTSGGVATWSGVPLGIMTIVEDVPLGYSIQPHVSCQTTSSDIPLTYSVVNATITISLDTPGQEVRCDVYNQFLGAGQITIAKWTCPQGYDYRWWDASPLTDCTSPGQDVRFTLSGPSGTYDGSTSPEGRLTFSYLEPGTYTLTESLPSGMASSFVWNCLGLSTSSVHPAPLATGITLYVTIGAGDDITCNWMNVPPVPPATGWLSLTKYTCTTPSYQSEIDCNYSGTGHVFTLQVAQGQTWSTIATSTTNAAGQVTFGNLQPGTYRLVEQNGTPCLIKSSVITNDGYLGVQAGYGTTVKIFNCGKPAPAAKTPTKFPNTGVDPNATQPTTPEPSPLLPATALLPIAAVSRRRLLGGSIAGGVLLAGAVLRQPRLGAQDIVPLDVAATPGATPQVDLSCMFPATPESGANDEVTCARGAVPTRVVIPIIEVDAPIEYLDLVDGEMEQPTGETDVAWYKPTARLGEMGNVLLAGHLNWWGVPEAVFFNLSTLQPGDVIEVTGDDDGVYRYVVEWLESFPAADPPPDDALGPTDHEALTLITCGGEWDASEAEYNQRTVVRAVREAIPSLD